MADEVEEIGERMAACALCPVEECHALAISYRPAGDAGSRGAEATAEWHFTCPRCGTEFSVPGAGLIFQSLPLDWLLAKSLHVACDSFVD